MKNKNPNYTYVTDPCNKGGEHDIKTVWEWDWRLDAYEATAFVCAKCGEELI